MDPRFSKFHADDVRELIAAFPLAWVISPEAPASSAGLLPLVGVFDADGALTGLVGHMARTNPLVAAFRSDPRAHVLFTGPQGYLSPEQAGNRRWAPTWNYAALRLEAEVRLSLDFTAKAVDRLVESREQDREQPWTAAELGERYPGMLGAIIGFEARITAMDGTFKLGQDETPEVFGNLMASLEDEDLRAWMARMRPGADPG